MPINFRLGPTELGLIFADSGPALVFADEQYREALPGTTEVLPSSGSHYEELLASAGLREIAAPEDEMTLLSINYTSGTTGKPKGVMYTPGRVPAFARGGRRGPARQRRALPVDAADVSLPRLGVHLGRDGGGRAARVSAAPRSAGGLGADRGRADLAPVWSADRADRAARPRARAQRPIDVFTGGAAPTPAMLERCETLGWHVTHLYGLTETYGPQVICGGTRSGTSCPPLGARRSRRARASRRWCRSCGWSTRR